MPLSWGRRYCVYKYQGFLFYIVTLVLSQRARLWRIFSISSTLLSILSVPIISNVLAGISMPSQVSFYQGDWSPSEGRGYMPDRRN